MNAATGPNYSELRRVAKSCIPQKNRKTRQKPPVLLRSGQPLSKPSLCSRLPQLGLHLQPAIILLLDVQLFDLGTIFGQSG